MLQISCDQNPDKEIPPHVARAIKELHDGGFLFGFDPRLQEDAEKHILNNHPVIEDPDDDTLTGQMVKTTQEEADDKEEEEIEKKEEDDDDDNPELEKELKRLRESERYRLHQRMQANIRADNTNVKKEKDEEPCLIPHLRLSQQELEEKRRRRERGKKCCMPFGSDAEAHSAA